MYNHTDALYQTRATILEQLCRLRGTSKLNELEKQAGSAIENICGRIGMETSKHLSEVLQYVAQNGYLPADKPLLQEIITRRYLRGFRT